MQKDGNDHGLQDCTDFTHVEKFALSDGPSLASVIIPNRVTS